MKEIIKKVRAPVRIDFGGGTTDIYPFTHTHGGAVLNAAINRYIIGKLTATDEKVGLEYSGNMPTSSGLGTSGVMNLVWLALISKTKNRSKLADTVYNLEQAMGLVGGKQDQYAAAFGGINFIEFKKDKVKLKQLKLDMRFIKELESKLVLVYTGKPHFSGHFNKNMIDNLKKGKNVRNLIRIREIAKEMKCALLKRDLCRFADLIGEETTERRMLHALTVSPHLEKFIDKGMRNLAISAKICGSGGGGSILFYTDNKKKLAKVFKKNFLDFRFDFEGLKWL